jgi:hypothetical protein
MHKGIKALMALLFVVFSASQLGAATFKINVDSLTFNAGDKQDVMGPASAAADGKYDASFTLKLSGAHAIKDIELKNETTGKAWSSSPSSAAGLLLVKDAAGKILNASGTMPVVPVLRGTTLTLYVSDAYEAIPKDSVFTVNVILIDDKVVTGKTTVNAYASGQQQASNGEGITELVYEGTSDLDLAGNGEKIGADGKEDHRFGIKLSFSDAAVTAIKLTAISGGKTVTWDTIPANKTPIIAVTDSGNNILNKTDGSVSLAVKGSFNCTLLAQDIDGVLSSPGVKVKMTLSLSDGRIFEKDAAISQPSPSRIALTAEYKGPGKYDFAGKSEKMESNLNADSCISVTLNTDGVVTGIKVKNTKNSDIWDTIPGNNYPLVVVTNEKGEKQNKADGSVSLQIKSGGSLSLWIDQESDKQAFGPYTVTMVMSNGQVLEASTAKTGGQSAPNVTKADRAVKFLSSKPAVINIDLVGKSKKRAPDGGKDTYIDIEITGRGKIVAMTVTGTSGGWDTLTSNNGRWLLGVSEGTKLLNSANGTVALQINGTKKYRLFMQDNGALLKKNGKLTLSVTWKDGQVTQSALIW